MSSIKQRLSGPSLCAILSVLGIFLFSSSNVSAQVKKTASGSKLAYLSVSKPITSGNLSVYLIHSKNQAKGQKLLTLNDALLKGKVVVHETGNVNQLSIENLGKVAVFIQSGEIVKGGKQDRTIQHDMILPPKSGKVPIQSFCVESGRWRKRGNESRRRFANAPNMVASKRLKLATKAAPSQSKVWNAVSRLQDQFVAKAKPRSLGQVKAAASPTSLQLTLESKAVKKLAANYVRDLKPAIKNKHDAIGYAFAINGKLNSVDLYNSNDLFVKLWPKLILASAQEAAAEHEQGKTYKAPSSESVLKYVTTAQSTGRETRKTLNKSNVVVQRETNDNLYYESRAKSVGWVHKNFLTK